MVNSKYADILLVRTNEGNIYTVVAPSYKAEIGDLVVFDGGALGVVMKKAWLDKTSDTYSLITAAAPVFDADKIYSLHWEKEVIKEENEVPYNADFEP